MTDKAERCKRNEFKGWVVWGFFELQFLKNAEAAKEHRKKIKNIFVPYAPIDQ